ncbi:hypothetical protein BOW53_15825 [Solemya pervernicosa gill symbiont]|uniref:Uncharacterized protein n=2 Tax=Gammaproteobacteria incertae sedis TaxID=118884 RepID=A0A1T2L023_9GAMM|nr:hypothetical protein [Candidatus Reidiella endopervernicosa]OOZ38360.1 hypothetical protein BOW53_15825 [Solemya pervernicosa gill symbiont]QKQ27874.1 hypothetical protein HUE57_17505 [Candidatus Reidiella endopervernicosa]
MTDRDTELEELVLKESIVSATGLNTANLQIGIKGDPSMRETALYRQKYPSRMDEIFEQLRPQLEELLLRRGTYRLYLGFNSSEVRISSVFDPLREETHEAEKLLDSAYLDRHFPKLSYAEKIEGMRTLYKCLRHSGLFDLLPTHWKSISEKRSRTWEPMEEEEIVSILSTIKVMRDMPDYYLRSTAICIVQDLVRMQFNCDGTQLVSAEHYKEFLDENLPS